MPHDPKPAYPTHLTVVELNTRRFVVRGANTHGYIYDVASFTDEHVARLFAAAPEMLEALQVALITLEHIASHAPTEHYCGVNARLRAAIAKATGA